MKINLNLNQGNQTLLGCHLNLLNGIYFYHYKLKLKMKNALSIDKNNRMLM